jgi:hypothetical protein
MRRRGRPALPKAQRKSVTLCARTDVRSYRQYRRAAQVSGMRFTDWIRERLRAAAEQDLAA